MKRRTAAGLAALAASILLYTYSGYLSVAQGSWDDYSWFHVYVAERASFPLDGGLLLGLDLARYNVAFDFFARLAGVRVESLGFFLGLAFVALTFLAAAYFSKDALKAGLASLLASTTPALAYWFRRNMFGPWLSLFLLPVAMVALEPYSNSRGRLARDLALGIPAALALWLLSGTAWAFFLAYSAVLGYYVVAGASSDAERGIAKPLALSIALAVPAAFGLCASPLHFASIGALAGVALGYGLSAKLGLRNASRRLFAVAPSLVAGALVGALVAAMAGVGPCANPTYKQYNPMVDYGPLGLLGPLAAVAALRGRKHTGPRDLYFKAASVSTMAVSLVAGYFDPTTALYFVPPSAMLASEAMSGVSGSALRALKGPAKAAAAGLAALSLVGFVGGGFVASRGLSSEAPSIYLLDLPATLVNKTNATAGGLPSLLGALKERLNQSALVVSYWGYTYYLLGYLGGRAKPLADPYGPELGLRLISMTMSSDEPTAAGILRRLAFHYNVTKAYVIVCEAMSIERTIYGTTTAHLGRAVLVPTPTGTQQAVFQPLGDASRLPIYVALSNGTLSDYFDYAKAQYAASLPLAWTDRAAQSLVAVLLAAAAKSMGYQLVNDAYSPQPLSQAQPRFFRLVGLSVISLDTVQTTSSTYNNVFVIALYELGEVTL